MAASAANTSHLFASSREFVRKTFPYFSILNYKQNVCKQYDIANSVLVVARNFQKNAFSTLILNILRKEYCQK